MKKISFLTAFVLVLSLVFSACGNAPEPSGESIDAYEKLPTVVSNKPVEIEESNDPVVPTTDTEEPNVLVAPTVDTEEPYKGYFRSNNMIDFLKYIDAMGETPQFDAPSAPLWSDEPDNAVFLGWLKEQKKIPIPVFSNDYQVTWCNVNRRFVRYGFYIKSENDFVMFNVEPIPAELRDMPLNDIVENMIVKEKPENYENRSRVCGSGKFGEYVYFGESRILMMYDNGIEGYATLYEALYVRYGDFLIKIFNRKAAVGDTSFADFLDIEMYEIK